MVAVMGVFSAPARGGGWCARSSRAAGRHWLMAALLGGLAVQAKLVDEDGAMAFDGAVLEDGFCSSPLRAGEEGDMQGGLNTNTMACNKLMEFIFISRLKVHEHLNALRIDSDLQVDGAVPAPWRTSIRRVSRASSLVSAHVHIIAALASQRPECFSEHVRLLLVVNLRRLKALTTSHMKQLWLMAQDGPEKEAELARQSSDWLVEASDLIDADLKTMRSVLRAWQQPNLDEARYYSHEADGRFSTMEALRRDTFDEWQADKGLLQGLVRHVFPLDATVADFGAGSGHYASWLNDTGLVMAFAFDGSPDIELVTKGVVSGADLGRPVTLWRTFDWAICIEVAEHIPPDFTPVFLRNLDAHAKKGLVISWSRPGLPGLGIANPQSESKVVELLRQHTGLYFDEDLTNKLRASASVTYLAESLYVLVREPRPMKTFGSAGDTAIGGYSELAPGCAAEEGVIYAGNDVQMFSNVASAAECCQLCSSNENCRFWTWSREETHKDLCWIKATREYRINHAGFVSGARGEAAS
eukprot:TRINITY_DN57490_c0_g1_i1.p1 TRINITY_DN57490_c0_g1~~TRINITY_DN57490_c0_g1_i1.p1  ORF type:complete len:527 (-),score=108.34 TRINITY_DN57490_c0_g1_i1:71-1651(-)